jgi:hypothetical protein
MEVESVVRRSTWRRTPFERRLMSDKPPYFSMSHAADDDGDALRRQALAQLAGL